MRLCVRARPTVIIVITMRRLFDALVAVVALLGLAAHLASRAGVRMELAAGLGQSEERQLAILTSLEQKGATRVERGRGKIFADYLRWYQKEHPGLNEDQVDIVVPTI